MATEQHSTASKNIQNTGTNGEDQSRHSDALAGIAEVGPNINGHDSLRQPSTSTVSKADLGPEAPVLGPALGPEKTNDTSIPLEQPEDLQSSVPLSPYSSNRALLRQYTLPT